MHKKHHYSSIASTQDQAKELIKTEQIDSAITIVTADEQTSGRGRYGKSWASPKNSGIYLSIIEAVENLEIQNDFCEFYTQAAAQATTSTLHERFPNYDFQIKPINDIYFNNCKLAGILVETLEHKNHTYIITGIGINIKNTNLQIKEKIIEEPKAPPISLEEILEESEFQNFNQDQLIDKLAEAISQVTKNPVNTVK